MQASLWVLPIALWFAALAVVAAVFMYVVIAAIVSAVNFGNSFGQGLEQLAELEIAKAAVDLFNGEEPVPPKGGARLPKA